MEAIFAGVKKSEANLDDFILAVEWLLQQQKPNYDFVLGLKHFFQGYSYWQRAEELMGRFMTLAEHNQDWPQAAEFGILRPVIAPQIDRLPSWGMSGLRPTWIVFRT